VKKTSEKEHRITCLYADLGSALLIVVFPLFVIRPSTTLLRVSGLAMHSPVYRSPS